MFPSLLQKGNVVLLAEAFLVCQPTAELTLSVQKKDGKGGKAFLLGLSRFQKWCRNQFGSSLTCGFSWQFSQKWLHSLCPYMLNVLWRCMQLTYLHPMENFVLSLLGSSPFPSTRAYLALFIHRWCYFIVLILSHPCAIIILFFLTLFTVCPCIIKRCKEQACLYGFFDNFEVRKIGYRRQCSEVVHCPSTLQGEFTALPSFISFHKEVVKLASMSILSYPKPFARCCSCWCHLCAKRPFQYKVILSESM